MSRSGFGVSFLTKQLSLLGRQLLRRNALTRARALQLVAGERDDAAKLRARQSGLLRRTLASARARLPAYSDLPAPAESADMHDWLRQHCPIVSKADLLGGRQRYYPNQALRKAWWPLGKTSGTSGSPLEVFRSIDSVIWEEAFQFQAWDWAGFRVGQTQAILRGDQVVPADCEVPPFWLWDRFGRQLFLSTRHLRKPHALAMLSALADANVHMLRAYPSAVFEFARLAEQCDFNLRLPAVVTGSEPLFPVQREQIERTFGCRVFDFYGMAERIAYAAQCEHGRYHLNTDYSWVEIVDADGRATEDFGHVVGTTLRNDVMPLLRYRIADRARWIKSACACGRTYPSIELSSGKVEDQLFDNEGVPVSASIITFGFKGLANIRRAQVAQIGQGVWEVRVQRETAFDERDIRALVANIAEHVTRKIEVQVRLVDDIALMPSGKFKWVSQEWRRV